MKKKILTALLLIVFALCAFTACSEVDFKINFVVDGKIYYTVNTSGGEKIKMPENPIKDDYTFDGWFWDNDVWEKPFTANSLLDAPLSSDMNVYAKFTKKHEHNYTAVVTASTCTERGYTTYTCECGDSYIGDYIDELGHDFGAWIETTAPTCTTKGVETRVCSRDNTHIETREINALGHTPETAVEENRQEPKCEVKGGYDVVVYCKTCGAELSREHKEIAALSHEFTNYVSDKNATYDNDGTKTAYCNHGCGEKHTLTDVGTKLQSGIAFKTLAVDGNNVYGKIPNAQTEFDFLTEIEKKGNVTFNVSRNLAGDDIIVSKTAEPSEGDNKYYILVYQNNELLSRYNVIIRRREIYDVTFNTDGGTVVAPQRIEEDSFATEPTTARAGYTFTGWDYIFDNSITGNTVITASWTANKDTKYKVEYYLQNLADDNYTLEFTDNLTGETDKQATAEIKMFEHFTFNEIQSEINGIINGNGTLVLQVYYTRDIYGFTVTNENTKGGTIDCTDNGEYKYQTKIDLSATVNNGYDFVGWYKGDTKVSGELKYSFTLTEKTDITAKYSAHKNTKYTVETYLENLDGTYTKQNTEEKFGETDTTAIIIPNVPEHYTFNENDSVLSGNINGDTTTVLKVYYARELYNISITAVEGITMDTVIGEYKYGTIIDEITVALNIGYSWQGWYSNNKFIMSNYIIPSFTVDSNINYVATCKEKSEMTDFNFSSTVTSCTITGVKDKIINQVIIPDCVTDIGNSAFSGCSSLTSVTISNDVKSIGSSAFYRCYSLTSITIPDSVTSIGDSAFHCCYKLVEVINKSKLTITKGSYANGDVGYYAVMVHNGESKIVNKDGYLFITDDSGNNYLVGYTGTVTSLMLPNDYNGEDYDVYQYAFYNFSDLKSITIPDSVTRIGDSAFNGCSSLQEITIPFVGRSKTADSSYYSTLFGYIFGSSSYTGGTETVQRYSADNHTYYIPSLLRTVTVTGGNILYGAFSYCSSLTSITIPDSVTSIEGRAFCCCSSLTSITIPDSVTSIGDYAFAGCSGLTSITIPDSVTSIGDSAFSGCSITSITIPNSVTSIKRSAFYRCYSLTSITIPDSVTSIGDSAFDDCIKLVEVINKSGLTITKGSYANGKVGYYALTVHNGESKVVNRDGYLFITDNGINYLLGYAGTDTELTLPSDYNGENYQIYKYAFYNCSKLTNVTFVNTSGWKVSKYSNMSNYTSLSSSSLANQSTAALYLKSNYSAYYWKRG